MQTTEDDVSLLVLVLDVNPFLWGQRSEKEIHFSTFLDHIMAFINTYLMLHHQNMLAVIASHVKESQFLFPQPKGHGDERAIDFSETRDKIISKLKELANLPIAPSQPQACMFSASLSLGLCYINRITKEKLNIKPRILIMQISPDVSSQYVPVMNCIFSAQKQSITVDSCILSAQDSSFLQQASHITGGVYIKPPQQEGLLQYLLSCFLADAFARKYLSLPALSNVDYRASCFCHKKIIDMGFVCSVCLSIFCSFSPVCTTCGAKFALPKLPTKIAAPPRRKQ